MGKEEHKVLKALDVTKTQWYHFTAIVVAGMGFFTDAYDLFSISLVTKLLGRIYYTHPNSAKPGTLPPNVSAAVNGVAFCGTLLGQLFFGWLGDKLGRKKIYGATLIIMAISSVASGLSFGHEPQLVIGFLCVCRFCLGFGIGGDYPLSATIMSEYSNKKTRGAFIAAVFAMQGLGNLTASVVAIIVSAAFKSAFPAPAYEDNAGASLAPQADYVWRIILMFGGAPALLTFYWRMKMPETARYTALVANNAIQAASDMSKAITAGILVGCSDFAAQKISGVKKLQFKRLFLLMIYGFFYSGPFGHFFHKVMDKIFKGKKGNTTLGQKVILEQLTASPWNNLCFMMYYGLVVEARTWSLVKSKVKKDYPSIQLTSWKFWPIINWVNYQYMPLQLRVLFHNLIASCWAIFLNLKARSATTIKKA